LKKQRIPKEFLGAFKEGHRPTAREFIDDEFSHALLLLVKQGNSEAKLMLSFIARFYNEYYKIVFNKTAKDLFKGKKRRQELYRNEYSRRMDAFSCPWRIEIEADVFSANSPEDALIELIDLKRETEKLKKQ
jgi:hypothetical protein